ncbi:hypothetical protein FRC03_010269 [Tulasnella sp. 419]|nr:hypothetical protein FRC03_010269 [Tulasnella sp. 419]
MDTVTTNFLPSRRLCHHELVLVSGLDGLSLRHSEPTTLPCFINILPFDILREIFFLCIDSPHGEVPLLLSSVCRKWRAYALDCPSMWSAVRFHGGGKWKFRWQEELLQRSRDAPLDIDIKVPFSMPGSELLSTTALTKILRMLLLHLDRWRSLSILMHLKGMKLIGDKLSGLQAPSLEKMALSIWNSGKVTKWRSRMFSGGLPRLRTWSSPMPLLTLHTFASSQLCHLREIILDDTGRTDGVLRAPALEEILSVLRCCPDLEVLRLTILEPRIRPGSSRLNIRKAHLPHLRLLSISPPPWGAARLNSTNQVLQLMAYIEAPLLKEIDRRQLSATILPIIITHNPFPSLQKLALTAWPQDGDVSEHEVQFYTSFQLRSAFVNLLCLQSLVFRDQIIPTYVFELIEEHCPELIHLGLDRCAFSLHDCQKMAKLRLEKRRGRVAALKVLKIWYLPPSRQAHGASTIILYTESESALWLKNNIDLYDVQETTHQDMEL